MSGRVLKACLAVAFLVTLRMAGWGPSALAQVGVEAAKPGTPCACPVITRDGDRIRSACPWPTGRVETAVILLEKVTPSNVLLARPFDYDLVVKNLTPCPLNDVVVIEHLPPTLEFKRAIPKESSLTANDIKWSLGQLKGHESKVINVTVVPKTTGPLTTCADVFYKMEICMAVTVDQPKIELSKTGPAEVILCDPISVKLVVTNTGTGVAKNVKIRDMVPDGLTTSDGRRVAEFEAGDIPAGESKHFSLVLKPERTGKFDNRAVATGEPDLTAEASMSTIVRQPVLDISKTASRQKVYLGQNVVFSITVANKGDAPAKDTVIKDVVPAGSSFQAASDGGQLSQNTVTWNIGTLRPDESKKVTLTVRGDEITKVMNTATAEAVCAAPVSASAPTEFAGIPAVLLEVIDIEDPVPLGENVTYVIEATNQGSAIDRNIKIVAIFEPNHQYVSSIGATLGAYDANAHSITFDPFPGLLPKAKAFWRVTTKAVKAGDVRIKVIMTTEMTTRPVEETEATHFYE